MNETVGILGLGVYLPPTIRRNDYWPPEVVEHWAREIAAALTGRAIDPATLDDDQRAIVEAMAVDAGDPFRGARERRVHDAGGFASEMEAAAALQAIADAGVEPDEIDFVLGASLAPDYVSVPDACRVHRLLGLAERCFVVHVDAACNAFGQQLIVSQALVRTGRFRTGLLFQSHHTSPLMRREDHWSAWWGDGATAQVVGPVAAERGLQASAAFASGENFAAMVIGQPGRRWFDDGRCFVYGADRGAVRRMVADMPRKARTTIGEALAGAGWRADEVDFYAAHQPATWFRTLTQRCAGLERARSLDTFSWAGTLSAANIPLVLHTARARGLLGDGDRVVTFSGGAGETWTACALVWGR